MINGKNFEIISSGKQATSYGLEVAQQRQAKIAEDAYNNAFENANKKAGTASVGAVATAAGTVGLGVAGACIASGPVGWAIGGTILLAGSIFSGCKANNASKYALEAQQAINLYNKSGVSDAGSKQVGKYNLPAEVSLTIFGSETNSLPSTKKMEEYAKNTFGEEAEDYNYVTLYKGGYIGGNLDDTPKQAELEICHLDSSQFTNKCNSYGEYDGLDRTSYYMDFEYEDTIQTFIEQSKDENQKLDKNAIEHLGLLAKALGKGYDNHLKFFDVNGDNLMNYADIFSQEAATNDETKAIYDKLIELDSWDIQNVVPILDQNNLLKKLNLFDFNGDGSINDADKAMLTDDLVAKDINGDGVADKKDTEILESYFKASSAVYIRETNKINDMNTYFGQPFISTYSE